MSDAGTHFCFQATFVAIAPFWPLSQLATVKLTSFPKTTTFKLLQHHHTLHLITREFISIIIIHKVTHVSLKQFLSRQRHLLLNRFLHLSASAVYRPLSDFLQMHFALAVAFGSNNSFPSFYSDDFDLNSSKIRCSGSTHPLGQSGKTNKSPVDSNWPSL